MSTLVVSNISDGTTTVGASYVTNGSAKAWANYDQSPTLLRRSFNTSSLTDISVGRHRVTFTSSFTDSDIITSGATTGGTGRVFTNIARDSTYTENLTTANGAGSANDNDRNSVAVHGDLA